jgi:DNA-binding CsgD family transcriptional regulator
MRKFDADSGKIFGISPATANSHIERVKKKFGIRIRTQATAMVVTSDYL